METRRWPPECFGRSNEARNHEFRTSNLHANAHASDHASGHGRDHGRDGGRDRGRGGDPRVRQW